MVVSLSFRRFVRQLQTLLSRRRGSRRLRYRRSRYWTPVAAMVETLETRVLLSRIVVSSTNGGQNYPASVTASQLGPTFMALQLRGAVNPANKTTGAGLVCFISTVFPPKCSHP